MRDGGIGGEGRGAEGAGSRGVKDMGGSGEKETGRRRTEGARRRKPTIATDEQTGEEMVDGVGCAATTRADDIGEDGRKLEEWGYA